MNEFAVADAVTLAVTRLRDAVICYSADQADDTKIEIRRWEPAFPCRDDDPGAPTCEPSDTMSGSEQAMGLYSRYVLPKVVHFTCGLKPNMRQREKVVPLALGRVLEIGIGSGLNLPYYDASKVIKVWGLDPSPEMTAMAKQTALSVRFEVEFIESPGDDIPLDDDSIDTVLVTYTLCTIPDATPALREMARVLKPGGTLVFCEHGAAPDRVVRRWQDALDPIWTRLGGGCHLNREIPVLIQQGGFTITDMNTMYLPGWRPANFNYWGTAIHG